MSTKRIIILIHTCFWVLHISLHWAQYFDNTPVWRLTVGSIYFMAFIYIHYFFLIPKIIKKPSPKYITIWLIIFILTHIAQGSIYRLCMDYFQNGVFELDVKESIRYAFLTSFYGAPLCLSTRLYYDWITTIKVNKELEIQALSNKIHKLKSEIDLPFAQRVIKSLESLAKSDPQAIQYQLIWFSNWLRFKLHHQETTTIKTELSVANDLICLLDSLFDFKINIKSKSNNDEINAGIIILVVRYLFDYNLMYYSMILTNTKKLVISGDDQHELKRLKGEITFNHQLTTRSENNTIIINLN